MLRVIIPSIETKVFAVREDRGVPCIVSTSRHITQGAVELESISFDGKMLSFSSRLVENDPYTVTVYVPDGFEVEMVCGFDKWERTGDIISLTVTQDKSGTGDFAVKFR